MARPILEREHEIDVLAGAVRDAASGTGRLVLIHGEAGIGKTLLVDAMRDHIPSHGRLLVGFCDDLTTKRTLGPFRDLVGHVGAELTRAMRDGGDRDQMLAALRAELDGHAAPTVLVVEDVHWADEATLDALRFLVRRVHRLRAVLVLTYRDDEVTADHPLQQLLGHAAFQPDVLRLPLCRLSIEAVRELSAGRPVDADQVFAVTSGNPFFVSEVLAAGTHSTPPTIVAAVLARVRRLPAAAREALEQLAVIPSAPDRWLVDRLVAGGPAALVAAEEWGLLAVSPSQVVFRHELTRRAVADSVPIARRIELNRRVLTLLVQRDGEDLSRIMHHAAEAGDLDAIVRYGPDAARDAARTGAHREAAAHYRLVLQQRDRFPAVERARLLEEYAVECYTVGAAYRAVAAQRDAVELRRAAGDQPALAAGLRWLSRMHWWAGDRSNAEHTATQALTAADATNDPGLRALAYSNQSQLHMLAGRAEASIAAGDRAAELARQAGDVSTLCHALTNVGLSRWTTGDPSGRSIMDEALDTALAAADIENACRAYVNIVWTLLDGHEYETAERYLAAAENLAEEAEYFGFLVYMAVEDARLKLARADWAGSVRSARRAADAHPPVRCAALTVLGRVAVRRGEPDAEKFLAQAWELAVDMAELQRTGPVAAARAEAAWLRGDVASIPDIVAPTYDEAVRRRHVDYQAELGHWLAKAGEPVAPPSAANPYALQAAGRWREAAAAWRARGCPYEYAAALADSRDPADLRRAFAALDGRGADPLAALIRTRLRDAGITRLPRGPAQSTRVNPAGLTARQVEVLRLVSDGLTNAEIADRLVVSVRTVDSHVAAVLAKIGAQTRRDARDRAAELGFDISR